MSDTTTTPAAARQILLDMRRLWDNTRYQTETELKIQDRLRTILGRDTAEAQKSLTDRLREIEIAVGVIDDELATVTA
jgi:phosphoribosylaminoimidazole-succinocarboxamide synthase